MYTEKSKGNNTPPCLTPHITSNLSPMVLFQTTAHRSPLYQLTNMMAKTVNGFKTKLERERAKKMGLFLD